MRNTKLSVAILYLIVCTYIASSWVVNLVQFCKLDFEPSYKEEIIKGLGVIFPPLSAVTVWF